MKKTNLMIWGALPLLVMLTLSCSTRSKQDSSSVSVNSSALHTPTTVTLLPRVQYQFKEGVLTLEKEETYHNTFSWLWALQTGQDMNSNK